MKKFFNPLFSTKTTAILLVALAIALGAATFIENKYDTLTARQIVYNSKWFELLLLLLVINFIGNIKRYNFLRGRKLAGFTFHLAFILMILGSAITRYIGFEGSMHIREGESSNVILTTEPRFQDIASGKIKLPFSIYLDKYISRGIPGSSSPSSYKSVVTLNDSANNVKERHEIYMNHVLDYGGYRFFQSSYDTDEKGTILSVNHIFSEPGSLI